MERAQQTLGPFFCSYYFSFCVKMYVGHACIAII